MKTKNTRIMYLLPVLLVFVLLVSGCTSGGGGTGPGVVILNFEPDFSSVESQDDVKLYLKIQNQGGMEAKEVEAELTGIDQNTEPREKRTQPPGTSRPPILQEQ